MRRSSRPTRLLYELLLSTYCAFLIVFRENGKDGSAVRDGLQAPLLWLDRILDPVLHRAVFSHDVAHLFFGSLALLAGSIFVFLHTVGRFSLGDRFLSLAGVVAVAGPPFCRFLAPADPYSAVVGLLWLEVALVAAGFLLYRRLRPKAVIGILVLLVHFGIWGYVLWEGHSWVDYLWQTMGILVLPFSTCLAWGQYVGRRANP